MSCSKASQSPSGTPSGATGSVSNHDVELGDVGFALRLRREPDLSSALDTWFEAEPAAPEGVADDRWLAFEQDKHQHLLNL